MHGMEIPPPLPSSLRFARRNAAALKLLLVGGLVLVLLVPLHLVENTLRERMARHDAAIGEIAHAWGGRQRLLGPVLVVPYSFKTEVDEWSVLPDGRRVRERTTRTVAAEAFFLPEKLDVSGELEPAERARGIYRTHVYAAKLRIAGRFASPDLAFTTLPGLDVQWARARVGIALGDLRGTREALVLKWGDGEAALQPGARLEGFGPGLHAPVKITSGAGPVDFALELTLNGSERFTVVPLGRQTTVRLASSWADPGFSGAFLPVRRDVTPEGFTSDWAVSHYSRDFPQEWSTHGAVLPPAASAVEATAFGVNLVETITAYRTIERAIKYGVLFLALVFAAFFLFEVASDVRLSALNYLLVGAALCLFYLGLLSLAEIVGFARAYAGAASASLLLIGLYGRSVLRSGGRSLAVSAMLGGVYGYLYFVLQMEDFALLAGTGALFVLLAAVMFATRRLDRGERESAPRVESSAVT
jgi:inner membrane protein